MDKPAAILSGQITGLLLAGGRGSRMGDVDKGLQLFRGEPLAFHVMQNLAPQVGAFVISANRNGAAYQAISDGLGHGEAVLCADQLAGFEGPLAGLQTGLRQCATEFLLSAPCDSPFLPSDLVQRLAQALLEQQADIAVAMTGDGKEAQVHRVISLMRSSVLPSLDVFLAQGGRKVGAWHASLTTIQVAFKNETAFYNINTLEELRQLESDA
ncbi:molybdenum cofactor guanylyltransferase MobA [Undibacterium sp. TJN25]|uniref:molybdenum cofactor guanylyltransferase MobA n=1 Tax=Undibacterium sp. TJN25 TaxID=3413056 RepID=UPI003BEF516F